MTALEVRNGVGMVQPVFGQVGIVPFVAAAAQLIPGITQTSQGGQDVLTNFERSLAAEDRSTMTTWLILGALGVGAIAILALILTRD